MPGEQHSRILRAIQGRDMSFSNYASQENPFGFYTPEHTPGQKVEQYAPWANPLQKAWFDLPSFLAKNGIGNEGMNGRILQGAPAFVLDVMAGGVTDAGLEAGLRAGRKAPKLPEPRVRETPTTTVISPEPKPQIPTTPEGQAPTPPLPSSPKTPASLVVKYKPGEKGGMEIAGVDRQAPSTPVVTVNQLPVGKRFDEVASDIAKGKPVPPNSLEVQPLSPPDFAWLARRSEDPITKQPVVEGLIPLPDGTFTARQQGYIQGKYESIIDPFQPLPKRDLGTVRYVLDGKGETKLVDAAPDPKPIPVPTPSDYERLSNDASPEQGNRSDSRTCFPFSISLFNRPLITVKEF
jgi:hypothetical protein